MISCGRLLQQPTVLISQILKFNGQKSETIGWSYHHLPLSFMAHDPSFFCGSTHPFGDDSHPMNIKIRQDSSSISPSVVSHMLFCADSYWYQPFLLRISLCKKSSSFFYGSFSEENPPFLGDLCALCCWMVTRHVTALQPGGRCLYPLFSWASLLCAGRLGTTWDIRYYESPVTMG